MSKLIKVEITADISNAHFDEIITVQAVWPVMSFLTFRKGLISKIEPGTDRIKNYCIKLAETGDIIREYLPVVETEV